MEDLKSTLEFWQNVLLLSEHLNNNEKSLKNIIKITLEDTILSNKKIEKIIEKSINEGDEVSIINYLRKKRVINTEISNILLNDSISLHSRLQNIVLVLEKNNENEFIFKVLDYLEIDEFNVIRILCNVSMIEDESEFYKEIIQNSIYTQSQLDIYKETKNFNQIKETLINKRNYELKPYKLKYFETYVEEEEKEESNFFNKIKSFF